MQPEPFQLIWLDDANRCKQRYKKEPAGLAGGSALTPVRLKDQLNTKKIPSEKRGKNEQNLFLKQAAQAVFYVIGSFLDIFCCVFTLIF